MNYLQASAENSSNFNPLGNFNQFTQVLSEAQNFPHDNILIGSEIIGVNTNGNCYILFTFYHKNVYQGKLFISCGPSITAGDTIRDLHFCECANSDGEVFAMAYKPKHNSSPKGISIF